MVKVPRAVAPNPVRETHELFGYEGGPVAHRNKSLSCQTVIESCGIIVCINKDKIGSDCE